MVPKPFNLAFVLLSLLAASCGAPKDSSSRAPGGERAVGVATGVRLNLKSTAFADGQPIPVQYTCDGANQAPILSWDNVPPGTKSFALVVDDPDAPSGTFRHWGVFDISGSARSIGGNQQIGTEVTNDFGKPGYGGPCPPEGRGAHHYHFKLFALSVERLGLSPGAKIEDVERASARRAVAEGELIGTYERK